jgi:trehalose utilization protein
MIFPHSVLPVVAILATSAALAADVRVLVWDEQQPAQKQAYGERFLGETIAAHLAKEQGFSVRTTGLDAPEQGLDEASLDATDVLIWWGHVKNAAITNANAERVAKRVREGRLSLVAIHSAHWAKPFIRLMQDRAKADALAQLPEAERATAKWEFVNESPIGKGVRADAKLTPFVEKNGDIYRLTLPSCVFPAWRADGAPSRVTTLLPAHPIAAGLPAKWGIAKTEMYSEPFHVPAPDEVVFEERWDKGEHFRSGCVWTVGKGRVFYFRPGHETYGVFLQAEPLRVISNATRWLGAKSR